ncbi:hypothetical protein RSP03_41990 [Cereibacter sphaeroides]|jgi:hypothetical protein|nr:hypothetical protein RSP03_41990 [Cereibacter sphaeroides]
MFRKTVVASMVPVRLDMARSDPVRADKLAKIQAASTYERRDVLMGRVGRPCRAPMALTGISRRPASRTSNSEGLREVPNLVMEWYRLIVDRGVKWSQPMPGRVRVRSEPRSCAIMATSAMPPEQQADGCNSPDGVAGTADVCPANAGSKRTASVRGVGGID